MNDPTRSGSPGHLRCLLLMLLCLPAGCVGPSRDGQGAEPASGSAASESVTAIATDTVGTYRLGALMSEVESVRIVSASESGEQRVLEPSDWTYDPDRGLLAVRKAVDPDRERVQVQGRRAIPWSWNLGPDVEPDSVRMLLGNREAIAGTDFEFDAAPGVVRLLHAEDCIAGSEFFLTYRFRADPSRPGLLTQGAIGNHSNRARIEELLGLPETEEITPTSSEGLIGLNGVPTDVDTVYSLTRPLRYQDMDVQIVPRDDLGHARALQRGRDYSYDPSSALVLLKGDTRLADEHEMLLVRGVPEPANVFLFHDFVDPDEVQVVIDEEVLRPGSDYRVDRMSGRVEILDATRLQHGAHYYVRAGDRVCSNRSDPSRVRDLLKESPSGSRR